MLLTPQLLTPPSGLSTAREEPGPSCHQGLCSRTVSSVCLRSAWLRLGFLLAGVSGALPPFGSVNSPTLVPLPPRRLPWSLSSPSPAPLPCPYALGVLISHFLPRPGAWPGPCPRSCALPQTLYSVSRDPTNQQQGSDPTHPYYQGLSQQTPR